MNRRHFLQLSARSLVMPVVLDGYGARAFSQESAFVQALAQLTDASDRVLVLIQLNGGNDGLNTVVPLDQYSRYRTLRSNIALPEDKVLRLANNPSMGLHPAMTGLPRLMNDGLVSVVHSVAYPQPSFSHFRSSDIWFTGADSNRTLTTGWMGRYLDEKFPDYPEQYPNAKMPDPLAIQIGAVTSTALLGPFQSMAVALQNPDTFAQLVGDKPNLDPAGSLDTPGGRNIAFIRQQQLSSVAYAGQIKGAADKGRNQVSYPGGNSLADQLRIVARLIHGGLRTRVYYVSLGGFDTHAAQVSTTDPTTGAHATLLRYLSDSIRSFTDDLKAMGVADRVVGMTFSEFGRRVVSNNSLGTDHGVAAPLFVFGNAVKTREIGRTPNLSDLDNNNLKMQTDFRQIYATVLADWLGEGQPVLTDVLNREFTTVPIFRQVVTGTEPLPVPFRLYPNPASTDVQLESDLLTDVRRLQLFDVTGRSLAPVVHRLSDRSLRLSVGHLPNGVYGLTVEGRQGVWQGKFLVAH